ncbi:HAMP domain-containing histidine kinase [Campylobacter sp. faydin G-24]|uniref:histidine kinase n=1 Tax=Campylobacter anatolicus TaxID=2829105 RepID=A0ABS5HIK9_9BACT|nr:ArsS family sensor histidine kinase [Campylobacter anatolicus]MBR8462718.1 HAMP domain-containing histidine kinase [Campylobacter anatolicus]MBR8464114.1 HAMP domain-containing histidine kinase [Campylobacter anatolicus]MBR8466019.1 HAMP domain-containing histidine kinase [Campylobacter anatolicus]
MQRSSIFITITFIFALALISIFFAFLWLMEFDKQNYTRELNTKYSNVARANLFYMSGIINEEEFTRQLGSVDMPEIKDENRKTVILTHATIIEEISDDIGSSAILLFDKHHYLKIQHLDEVKLLKDKEFQPYRYEVIKVVFVVVALILLGAYIFVLYKIKPLRRLKRQIDKFAAGNLNDVANVSRGNDEISEVSQAFYDAVCQIKTLNDSRHLFLRNIMHELKTPITKGLIAAQMIESGKNQERLISVFHKLESLINELAAIEQTTSKIALSNKTTCFIEDLMDEALDIAMIEKDQVSINELDEVRLNVDFKLFAIAIKNMIDNGIKYSSDKHVNITISNEYIKFITQGERLKNDLKFYIEPFIKGENAQKSFGLGLYIVSNILEAHGLRLGYEYKNSLNIFSFENLKGIITK